MWKRGMCLALAAICLLAAALGAHADGSAFEDTEFRGRFTTEALDEIIEKYELYDGWYWTTQAFVTQTFHGQEDKPGWTDTAVNVMEKKEYNRDWFGCRWNMETIDSRLPNGGGWGECFGFGQFIGFLLSGQRNPHRDWHIYYSLEEAGGLKPGDLVRAEYKRNGKQYRHSAVVYSANEDEVLFMQVSGGNFNLLRVRQGYTDGNLVNETSLEAVSKLPGIRIIRCPLNE